MKKFGYTLAETLITFTIIGIVTAMTIPSLVKSHSRQVYASTLSTAVTDFETAMSVMIMNEGVVNLAETAAWKELDPGQYLYFPDMENTGKFVGNISQTFNVAYYDNNSLNYYEGANIKNLDGEIVELDESTIVIVGKNGVAYHIGAQDNKGRPFKFTEEEIYAKGGTLVELLADVTIDVNGKRKPNIYGRDIFVFKLDPKGKLYPYGGIDYAVYVDDMDTRWQKDCADTSTSTGYSCTARVIENGYKMDY